MGAKKNGLTNKNLDTFHFSNEQGTFFIQSVYTKQWWYDIWQKFVDFLTAVSGRD